MRASDWPISLKDEMLFVLMNSSEPAGQRASKRRINQFTKLANTSRQPLLSSLFLAGSVRAIGRAGLERVG